MATRIELGLPSGHRDARGLASQIERAARELDSEAKLTLCSADRPGLTLDGVPLHQPGAGPEVWQIEAALLGRRRPGHLLFLCVANSARSQLAEGLARAHAPAQVRISSAGSRPAFVHPLATTVLEERGIDVSSQYSKALEAVDCDSVDCVIALCEKEVCPVFPGSIPRLHWALPDPAQVRDAKRALADFRRTRDELGRRLELLFAFWQR